MGRAPILVLVLHLSLFAPARAAEDDLAALGSGVGAIGVAGVPGPLCVFGEEAFPVIVGSCDGSPAPLVAAARWGRGRVVAFGHNGYLAPDRCGAERLFSNAIRWSAGRGPNEKAPTVATWRAGAAAAFLRREGFPVEEVGGLGDGIDADVLVLDAGRIPDAAAAAAVARHVRSGGGLVCGSLGWGWLQLNPGRSLRDDHPGNRLLADAGIAWADGTMKAGRGGRFPAGAAPSPLVHARDALTRLAGKPIPTAGERAAASAAVIRAIRTLPGDSDYRVAVARLVSRADPEDLVPTPSRPLGPGRALARVLLAAELEALAEQSPEEVRAHPASEVFPGPVPRPANRVTRTVVVDASAPDWTSTGLYAPPGEEVRVEIPRGLAGAGLAVRIGCHKDRLWHKDAWKRVPEITRVFPLSSPRTEVASAFGGLVYVVVPRGLSPGTVPVRIEGAVPAPLFLAGRTDPEEWRREVRNRPAPWAEIGSSKLIVTVPSEVVRGIDDPTQLTDVWDRILDLDAELAARPAERERPERIVCDVQISAGYMHAGYPIMVGMDQIRKVVDPEHLRKGSWGLFHELGHNHQSRDWTFDGTGEVTVNLFTLYVFDRFCGIPPEKHRRTDAAARRKRMDGYLAAPDFGAWKRDPFLALTTYVQLQQAFGWEAFRDVFAEYRTLAKEERPKGDAEKRDRFLVRFSRRVGRNLGPFFARWGIPVSDAARKAVADLPDWMPEEMAK